MGRAETSGRTRSRERARLGSALRHMLFGFALVGVLAVAGAVGYRAWAQYQTARRMAISSARGISEQGFVRIGGIDQWISIRGEDRANPVILILHGGPGSSLSLVSPVFRAWEKHFTVVQWDQRGSGRTFGRNGRRQGQMSVEQMTRDGLEVSDYLTQHLGQKKIVLLGLSWGSELGLLMIKRRPELFAAYVGTGQVVAKSEKEAVLYRRLMSRLQASGDADGLARMRAIGPPPYRSEHDLDVERSVQSRFDTKAERGQSMRMARIALTSPDVSLRDIYDFTQGQAFAGEALYRELLDYDARKLGPQFAMPILIINGDRDLVTPPDLIREWFDTVRSPHKDFVVLNGGGHSAILTMPDEFLNALLIHLPPAPADAG